MPASQARNVNNRRTAQNRRGFRKRDARRNRVCRCGQFWGVPHCYFYNMPNHV